MPVLRRRRQLLLAAATLVTVAAWGLSQAGSALVVQIPAEPPDAIVPLASHEWERLPAAAALARRYPASLVLLTVPAEITDANCHRCSERATWLVDLGLSAERILTLPDWGSNTRDEAAAVRRYAEQHPLRRLAIVTSPYHSRRALATFRHAFAGGRSVIGVYPAGDHSPAEPARWWTHAYDRAYVAYEWSALLFYRLRFGIPLARPADGVSAGSARRPVRCDMRIASGWRKGPAAA